MSVSTNNEGFSAEGEEGTGVMKKLFMMVIGVLILSGCATSTSQTHYIDAAGHDCLKTIKKVASLGIAISESIECSENNSFGATQAYKSPDQMKITRKKHWFFLWLF